MTFHIVRMNEKIEKIALNYQVELEEIKELNRFIKDWNHLIPGTKLRLPEISTALNEELDNEEPFIEEYYPTLLFKEYDQVEVENVKQEEIKTDVIKEETTKKTQELVLPNNQYNANGNLQFYYNPYYYYQQNSRYRRR